MKKLDIVSQFALRSLLFVTIMALILGLSITFAVRALFLEEAARVARVTANAVILDHIRGADLSAGALPEDLTVSLGRMTSDYLLGAGITTIKLWNVDGKLVYSTDGVGVGESYSGHDSYDAALRGEAMMEVITEPSDENRVQVERYGPLIEVYAPLVSGGVTIGVFEVYQLYEPVASSINRFVGLMWVIIILGSVPAYFLQLTLVKRTSDELSVTKGDLALVNERLRDSLDDMELHSLGTLQALVAAVDAKDSYTARHSIAVTDYAVAIGRRMGLASDDLADLERAGLLHDVGKIGTAEGILLKPDRLTDEEFTIMAEHSSMSGHIVEAVPSLSRLMPVLRAHHERWDGSGYPDGLAGERIPMLSRILSVADAFDAMTSDRPYRSPVSADVARVELVQCSGSQFDPAAVSALIVALEAQEIVVSDHHR